MAHYDLLVIGTGPAGQKAAVQAAKLGKKVGLIERKEVVGGVCINTGTIPSKALREAALFFSGIPQRSIYGTPHQIKSSITIEQLTFHANHVIKNEIQVVRAQMARNRIDMIFGSASFFDPHSLRIQHRSGSIEQHTADFIVIAVGTEPSRPADIPFDNISVIDTDELLTLQRIPTSIVIVGGGVIGTEYASILAALGVPVTLIEKRSRLLEFADAEIIDMLQQQMKALGVTLYYDEEVLAIKREPDNSIEVCLRRAKPIRASTLMYAIGRVGATKALNLEAAGLKPDGRGRIAVNTHFQTAVPHIYAAGDVIGFPALASTSMQQGRHAACHAFGHPDRTDNSLLPYGIYSIPQISMVGRNEEELTQAQIPYAVGIARYKEIARGLLMGDETGMLKLLFNQHTHELLGVHAIGEGATEMIHIGQAVMAYHGRIDYFIDTVFNYPTLAECYKVAALDGINRLPRPWPPARET
ncbi:MAG: Si-specific NAD(P)(+) transhydrogenase [Nitrospiraceae bacterium]|jgi:NAD(P) transhydrogenase|uniref:Si-specific NAD(P)(+) transhydrogenase n=1 Tax=Nitrospira cf. moscoviensis SBR1015 TaxID=96242 RepID=UPI000A0D74BE|nr:Si-specific NAD(P)(+) transhydrogenase [Nitrospira cf. moscoviensis SBR1015]MBY0246581.1 Si-specific NAD(P)(+) transhydrogenase [Nitrospiraceae bacterium]OQW31998.1 MAG: NAD(P)(+) transhydrogenase [Nitrospira sp. SG-bin2]